MRAGLPAAGVARQILSNSNDESLLSSRGVVCATAWGEENWRVGVSKRK